MTGPNATDSDTQYSSSPDPEARSEAWSELLGWPMPKRGQRLALFDWQPGTKPKYSPDLCEYPGTGVFGHFSGARPGGVISPVSSEVMLQNEAHRRAALDFVVELAGPQTPSPSSSYRRAEHLLSANELPVATFAVDRDVHFTMWNQELAVLSGWEESEVVAFGIRGSSLFKPKKGERGLEELARTVLFCSSSPPSPPKSAEAPFWLRRKSDSDRGPATMAPCPSHHQPLSLLPEASSALSSAGGVCGCLPVTVRLARRTDALGSVCGLVGAVLPALARDVVETAPQAGQGAFAPLLKWQQQQQHRRSFSVESTWLPGPSVNLVAPPGLGPQCCDEGAITGSEQHRGHAHFGSRQGGTMSPEYGGTTPEVSLGSTDSTCSIASLLEAGTSSPDRVPPAATAAHGARFPPSLSQELRLATPGPGVTVEPAPPSVRALVMDSTDAVRMELSQNLERFGLNVVSTASLREAMWRFERSLSEPQAAGRGFFDVIFLEFQAGGDGFFLAVRDLRRLEEEASILRRVPTGAIAARDRLESLKSGAVLPPKAAPLPREDASGAVWAGLDHGPTHWPPGQADAVAVKLPPLAPEGPEGGGSEHEERRCLIVAVVNLNRWDLASLDEAMQQCVRAGGDAVIPRGLHLQQLRTSLRKLGLRSKYLIFPSRLPRALSGSVHNPLNLSR